MTKKRLRLGYITIGVALSAVSIIHAIALSRTVALYKRKGIVDMWPLFQLSILKTMWLLTAYVIMWIDLWWQNKLITSGRDLYLDIKPALISSVLGLAFFYYFNVQNEGILLLSLPLLQVAAYGALRIFFRAFE